MKRHVSLISLIIWAAGAIGSTIMITSAIGSLGGVVVASLPIAVISLIFVLRTVPSKRERNGLLLAGIGLYL